MNNSLLVFCSAFFLAACGDANSGKWHATRQIQAYEAVDGGPSFVVAVGVICQKGQQLQGKTARYTEVLCGNQRGWIIDDEYLQLEKT